MRSKVERLITLSTSEVAVCCCSEFTQLIEQPRVLDSDDGLGGEVLHQLDLLVGEGADLLPVDHDGADELVVLEHRYGRVRPRPAKPPRRDGRIAFCQIIGALRHGFRLQQASEWAIRARLKQTTIALVFRKRRRGVVTRSHPKRAIFVQVQIPNLDSHSRVAFSNIAVKTGSNSPGEPLITLSTSAVAVCCCSRDRRCAHVAR